MKKDMMQTSKTPLILSVIAVVLALLIFVLLLFGGQTVAWFKSFLQIENDAQLTNFVVGVEYCFDDGLENTEPTWYTLESGHYIGQGANNGQDLLLTLDNLDSLRIRPTYQGESAAYLRVSLHGGFVNTNTQTVLPQPDSFWSFKDFDESWMRDGEFCYYTQRLENMSEKTPLAPFSVAADVSALGTVSDHQDYSAKLYVIVDAVQPDRYTSIWSIASLPFDTTT